MKWYLGKIVQDFIQIWNIYFSYSHTDNCHFEPNFPKKNSLSDLLFQELFTRQDNTVTGLKAKLCIISA